MSEKNILVNEIEKNHEKTWEKLNNRFLDDEKRLSLSEWPLWVELPLIGLLERLPPKPPRRDFIVDMDR